MAQVSPRSAVVALWLVREREIEREPIQSVGPVRVPVTE